MNPIYNNIFQTHKSIEYIKSKPKLSLSVKTWLKYVNNFKYYFYNDNMCKEFMQNIVGGDIYKAYQKLPMNVMKADLWRYCVIYEYGGIYADVDTLCKVNPNIFLTDALLTIVPENSVHLCQWVFAAPKKSPILKEVIDLSVKRILDISEIKGEHIIHELTGPGVFTDGIESYLKKNNLPTFPNNRKLYYRYPEIKQLRVFNADNFHKNMVLHLFAGTDNDGWCKERNEKLLK
jgi:mannosyltransferase OCH1-like enzyme